MESLRWAIRWLGKKKWYLTTTLVLCILAVIALAVEPFIFKNIIDEVIGKKEYDKLIPNLAISLGFGLTYVIVRFYSNIFSEKASMQVIYEMRKDLFSKILSQTHAFFRKNTAGELITLCTGDADIVRHCVCWVLPRAVECGFMLILTLSIFVAINPLYALCLFILTPFSAVLVIKMGKVMRPAHGKVREQRSRLSTVVNENLAGNRIIKAFTREAFEIEKFDRENYAFRDYQIEANRKWLRYQPFIEMNAQLLNIVNIIVGAIFVITSKGEFSLGEMNIFIALAWALNEPMLTIGTIVNDAQRFSASAEKLMQLYYAPCEIATPENPYKKPVKGDIDIKNASLRIGSTTILENINLSIKQGQTIGIMGPTGSGKTALASLIPRYIDVTEGSVGIDGVNVKEYDLEVLRGSIGTTMQDVFLFSDSVENNVTFGNVKASMEEVIRATDTADAAGFVRRLPQGYDTIVGERGTGLSGGQKQRLSLARALLPAPQILILDDTTSAVDMETEKAIQEKLAKLEINRTTIIIAQRVSSLKHADRIFILADGKISEQGTHDDLINNKGYYYDTCLLQHADIRLESKREVG